MRSKFMCRLTGGHRYNPWECRLEHVIDGLYSITCRCTKCGNVRQDIVPIKVPKWENRIEEVRRYDGK